jgi:prophage regulatory protein
MLEGIDKDFRQAQPPTRLIRLKEVQNRVGLGRSTIYRWMAEGNFPKPVRLGGHAVAWVLEDIDRWVAQRIA